MLTYSPAPAPVTQTSDYGRRLPERLTEINLLWELARTGDAEALADLHRHALQLSSAAVYGYDRLADAAQRFQASLAELDAEDAGLTPEWTDRLGADVTALAKASEQEPAAAATAAPGLPDPEEREEAVVLVADDDPLVRDTLCSYLERAGFLTVTAANGREALDRIRKHHPDVVLMDLQMPEMAGLDAIRHLREDDAMRSLPVIVLTAHDETDTVLKVLSLEVSGYLVKPAEASDVVSKVFNILLQDS